MNLSESLGAMIGRMTERERRLTGALVAALVLFLGTGTYLAKRTVFGGIQEEIDHDRQVLAEMRDLAPRYLELDENRRQIENAIRENQAVSVRVAANDMLKKIELSSDVPNATGNKLSDVVSFEGKTTETPIDGGKGAKKKPKGPKGKDEPGGIVQVEQGLEFREVPVDNLFAFLDGVEQSRDLLFVTRLDIARKFNDMSHVRSMVTLATFHYSGGEPAGAAPGPAAGSEAPKPAGEEAP